MSLFRRSLLKPSGAPSHTFQGTADIGTTAKTPLHLNLFHSNGALGTLCSRIFCLTRTLCRVRITAKESMISQPNVVVGTLLQTDIPTKQLILYLDRENDNNIIIEDTDDTHVFINSQYVEYVKENVAQLLEINFFEKKDLEGK